MRGEAPFSDRLDFLPAWAPESSWESLHRVLRAVSPPVSNIFLRLIKSIIAPLLFGTLVYGIAGTGSMKAMGRIGIKAIIYFEVVTTITLFLGLGAVNLVRPGEGTGVSRLKLIGPRLASKLAGSMWAKSA